MSPDSGRNRRYAIKPSNRYARDVRRLAKAGYDLDRLEETVEILASGERLPDRFNDHEMKGDLKGIRECHIGPDWLLMYVKDREDLVLLLLRTGTHRAVLGRE